MKRPSSLPMLAQCPAFESSGSDYADEGTERHEALKAYLAGDDSLAGMLDEEDATGVRWAGDYIKLHAPTSDHPLIVEQRVEIVYPNFEDAAGTPDVVCGPELFDFKWRRRDYTAQMAAYALPMLDKFDRVRVHVLFGCERRPDVFYFDRQSADDVLTKILDRCENPTPTPCDYCGWCAKRLTCPALTGPAKHIALNYAEANLADVASWHPSQMEKAEDIALALFIWRKILKKWGESVEFHAMEAATKKGLKLPGVELADKKGRKFVANVEAAYEASGLPGSAFLKCCDVRLNTSKKYPDRKGLDTIFKEHFQEASTAAAKRAVARKLSGVIQNRPSSQVLKLVGTEEEEEE